MTREHKIGIAVTCTFLCLTGAVIGLKMQDDPAPANPPETETASLAPPDPTPAREKAVLYPRRRRRQGSLEQSFPRHTATSQGQENVGRASDVDPTPAR